MSTARGLFPIIFRVFIAFKLRRLWAVWNLLLAVLSWAMTIRIGKRLLQAVGAM